jgi:hypothetical protein
VTGDDLHFTTERAFIDDVEQKLEREPHSSFLRSAAQRPPAAPSAS